MRSSPGPPSPSEGEHSTPLPRPQLLTSRIKTLASKGVREERKVRLEGRLLERVDSFLVPQEQGPGALSRPWALSSARPLTGAPSPWGTSLFLGGEADRKQWSLAE